MALNRFGVYTTESVLRASPPPTPSNSDTLAAFFGEASRGPVTPTLVTSWPDYQNRFGTLEASKDLGYAIYHYFTNGGRVAYVNRVVGSGATAASSTGVGYSASGGASVSAFTTHAANPGAWGNSLSLVVSAGTVTATSSRLPSFRMSVLLSGTEVETWTDLTLDPNDGRYVESVINNFSSYITVSNVANPAANSGMYMVANTVTLANGADGSAPTTANYNAALDLLDQVEGTLLINVVGKSTADIVNHALGVAAARNNSFVIIDPDGTKVSGNDVDASGIKSLVESYSASPGYGAVYYPMLSMVDPIRRGPAAVRTTYPGGAIAGAFIRTDIERGVSKTPAGYTTDLRGALNTSVRVSDTSSSLIYDSGVNVLKAVPGAGVVVLGGRTLERSRPDKFISVRRSLNYVKQGVEDITRSVLFEPNDANLWQVISTRVDQFLTTFWGRGGLKGNVAAQAFYVTCNSSNNTAADQEDGVVNVEIGVALQYPAEFIVVNISQWTGGSNTSETLPTL